MRFTVEILSGLCNVLKSFVTAISIDKTNILPLVNHRFDADFSKIFDDSLICHGPHEFGKSFISARFLILKSEEMEQADLINDAKILGDHPNIDNKSIAHLFSKITIDWFFDRILISDKVFNRIQSGIKKIKWKNEVLSEVNKVSKNFIYPLLTIHLRTWTHMHDPPNISQINDGVTRNYNFNTYKNAIDRFLPRAKTIFITSDNDSVLPKYLEYLKNYNVITYSKPKDITELQYSAAIVLLGAKSNMLVCSRLSTFSECMWWFGECKAETIAVF